MVKKSKLASAILIFLLAIGCATVFISLVQGAGPQVYSHGISRVQSSYGNTLTNSIAVTLPSTPTVGNILVATVAIKAGSALQVNSVTETNVVWTLQVASHEATWKCDSEIWVGVVSASASTSITFALNASTSGYGGVANVVEYSGILTSGFLDKTAINSNAGDTVKDTGTTATTTQNFELWIGSLAVASLDVSTATPTNTFAKINGLQNSYMANLFLEKMVSTTGDANSAITVATGDYAGCIATFIASSQVEPDSALIAKQLTTDGSILSFSATTSRLAEAFITPSSPNFTLASASFMFSKAISPTGSLSADIYAIQGSYGTDATPIGLPLATANNTIPASNLPSSSTIKDWRTFWFSPTLHLAPSTPYILVITNSVPSSSVVYMYANNTNSYSGNQATYTSGAWAVSNKDFMFQINGVKSNDALIITVNSTYGSSTASSGVLNAGDSYATSVTSPEAGGAGIQYVCSGYSIDGGQEVAGTSYTFTDIQANHTITYNWKTQYYIQVNSAHGSPTQSSQWVDAFNNFDVDVSTPVSGGAGVSYLCVGFYIDGGGLNFGTGYTFSNVQTNHTISYLWQTDYFLNVTSSHGSPMYQGWYAAGTIINFWITTPDDIGNGTQYVFSGWSGTGTGAYNGLSASPSVTLNNPITEVASWQTQHQIVSSSDAHSTVTPNTATWVNAGSFLPFTYSATFPYLVSQVLVDGSPVSTTGSYNFTNVQANHTLSVLSVLNFFNYTASLTLQNNVLNQGDQATFNITVTKFGVVFTNYVANVTKDGALFATNVTGNFVDTEINPQGHTYNVSALYDLDSSIQSPSNLASMQSTTLDAVWQQRSGGGGGGLPSSTSTPIPTNGNNPTGSPDDNGTQPITTIPDLPLGLIAVIVVVVIVGIAVLNVVEKRKGGLKNAKKAFPSGSEKPLKKLKF